MTADSELVIFRKKRSGKSRREQEPTEPVSVETIMRCRAFVAGVKDARAGLSFHSDYERWEVNDQWNYERGRAWATLAPRELSENLFEVATGREATNMHNICAIVIKRQYLLGVVVNF
jgi:hypothetical protein